MAVHITGRRVCSNRLRSWARGASNFLTAGSCARSYKVTSSWSAHCSMSLRRLDAFWHSMRSTLLILSTSQRGVLARVVFTRYRICFPILSSRGANVNFSYVKWCAVPQALKHLYHSYGLDRCSGHRHWIYLPSFDTIILKYKRFTMYYLLDYNHVG
jgi:hypothetical protein